MVLYTRDAPMWYRLVEVPGGLALVVHSFIADDFDYACSQSEKLIEIRRADPRIRDWQLFSGSGWGCGGAGAFDGPRPELEGSCWIHFHLPYPDMREGAGFARALDLMGTLTVGLDWLNRNAPRYDSDEQPPDDKQAMLIQPMCAFHGYNVAIDASPAFRQWLANFEPAKLVDDTVAISTESFGLLYPGISPRRQTLRPRLERGALQLIAEAFALNPGHIGGEGEGFSAETVECDTPERALVVLRTLAAFSTAFTLNES